MCAMIPYGLVNITNTSIKVADSTDYAALQYQRQQVLFMFWKVHDVAYKTSRHVSDARGRNLFWRTWSCADLSKKISTARLTAHWNRCKCDLDLSPIELSVKPDKPEKQLGKRREAEYNTLTTQEQQSLSLRNQEDAFKLSISDDKPVSTMFNTQKNPGYIDISQLRDLSQLSPTEGAAAERGTPGRPQPSRNSSSRNKVTVKGRNRPTTGRRKSSQGGSQYTKASKSPVISLRKSSKDESGASIQQVRSATSTFESLSPSSWEDEPAVGNRTPVRPDQISGDSAGLQISPDFRSKFVEKVTSSSNLVGMGRMKKTGSVVHFADERRKEDGSAAAPLSTTFEEELHHNLPHRRSTSSVAVSDSDLEEDQVVLPTIYRSASSLSMALAEERRSSLSSGTKINTATNRQVAEKKKSQDMETDDEQLLAMARRDGVTKAGGIQVPPQHRLTSNLELEYSPPESDLTF